MDEPVFKEPYFFSPIHTPQRWGCFKCKALKTPRLDKVEGEEWDGILTCLECGHQSKWYTFDKEKNDEQSD